MARNLSNIRRGRLSPEEERRIEKLAALGQKPGQVAVNLNRHPGTINFAFHRLGLRPPADRRFAFQRGDGGWVRSFSAEEDDFITSLRAEEGLSSSMIARRAAERFGHRRTAATIRVRLLMLANREDAAAPEQEGVHV